MFLIVPIIIVLASLLAWGFMVWRKFPYLKKLSPDVIATSNGGQQTSFWREMYPEIYGVYTRLDWPQRRKFMASEMEKIVRKARLMILKVESLFMRMADSLRSHAKKDNQFTESALAQGGSVVASPAVDPLLQLKQEEQRLIMEIAKNPRDAELYERLGDVYAKMGDSEDAQQSYQVSRELASK